jgi:hypothetical protein
MSGNICGFFFPFWFSIYAENVRVDAVIFKRKLRNLRILLNGFSFGSFFFYHRCHPKGWWAGMGAASPPLNNAGFSLPLSMTSSAAAARRIKTRGSAAKKNTRRR